jgi:hypothetical protein
VVRDLRPGDRAGLAGGERARRAYDVFLQRPRTHRNAVWEADHVEAAVEVDVEGRLRLAGYEVYRFGGQELMQPGASDMVATFFTDLQQHMT